MNSVRKGYFGVVFCVIALLLSACGNGAPAKQTPAVLIDRDTMVALVAKSYIVEGEIFYSVQDENKKQIADRLYEDFFVRHHISRKVYTENCEYYLSDKEKSAEFMQAVMQTINDKRNGSATTEQP